MVSTESSQRAYEGGKYFPAIETHVISSKYVAQSFKIQVMRPPQKRGETRRYPVVYATDGNCVFGIFNGISWLLQGFTRESPPFILVAIGYPSDSPIAGEMLRGRDFTFGDCPNFVNGFRRILEWEGVLSPEEGAKDFCGAADFQRFIGDELVSFIDDKYQTIPGDRTYFGHSMGGGFGLFTLFTQTHLFRNYIISSPAVLYHGVTPAGIQYENHDFLLRLAREFIAAAKSLSGIRLYMSVGTEEEFEPLIANWQFTSSFYRIAALIKAAPVLDLELTIEAFTGETHASVWPMAFIHGVRAVFYEGGRKPDAA
jgi:uncharacterized protein